MMRRKVRGLATQGGVRRSLIPDRSNDIFHPQAKSVDIECQVTSIPLLSQVIVNSTEERTGIFKHKNEQTTKYCQACDEINTMNETFQTPQPQKRTDT